MKDQDSAKHLLVYYFRLIAEEAGIKWTIDNDAEVANIVDLIIDSAAEEGARRALLGIV